MFALYHVYEDEARGELIEIYIDEDSTNDLLCGHQVATQRSRYSLSILHSQITSSSYTVGFFCLIILAFSPSRLWRRTFYPFLVYCGGSGRTSVWDTLCGSAGLALL